MGNWELDVAVEDARFAHGLERMYEQDLTHATEIVLSARRRIANVDGRVQRHGRTAGSARRAAAGAIGIGSTLGAAMANRRTLGRAEARVLGATGTLLLLLTVVVLAWPWLLVGPTVIAGGWIATATIVRALKMGRGTDQTLPLDDHAARARERT
jgi:cardiolipin synthase